MPQVKVRRHNISAEQTAAVIRNHFGEKLEITTTGERELSLQQSFFTRAKVSFSDEPGGTLFKVHGAPVTVVPLFRITMRLVNTQGIAKRVAEALGADDELQADG
jgi:hypothetical protein